MRIFFHYRSFCEKINKEINKLSGNFNIGFFSRGKIVLVMGNLPDLNSNTN